MENRRDQQSIQKTDKVKYEDLRIKLNCGQETLDELAITVVCDVPNSVHTYFCKNQNPTPSCK